MPVDPISVVVTVRDEATSVEDLMRPLLNQTRAPDEIVVADGGSVDGTPERIEEIAGASQVPIRLRRGGSLNIASGRNLAIAEAAGPIVAVTDAGTTPRPDWLERLTKPLVGDSDVGVSSGFFRPGGRTLLQRILAIVITPQIEETQPATFLPSSRSVAFRKGWWERVGGYPEWLDHCEDLVFDMKLRDAGARFVFAPDAIVVWDARPTLSAYARQYFLYGRGDAHAGLWWKRHASRYVSYLAGLGLVAATLLTGSLVPLVVLLVLAAGYMAKFYRRLWRIRPGAGARGFISAILLTPVIVVLGDLAKMAGYATGKLQGSRRRRPARRMAPAPSDATRH